MMTAETGSAVITLYMVVKMARQELRDRNGKLVGCTEKSGCRVEGRDVGGRLRGWYHSNANQTYDAGGRLVAKGNVLTALIC